MHDATFMTHNRFSDFDCVYTLIQVVHTQFVKVARTEYSVFMSLSKMIQEHAVNYYTNFSEKQAKEKETKKKSRYETVA